MACLPSETYHLWPWLQSTMVSLKMTVTMLPVALGRMARSMLLNMNTRNGPRTSCRFKATITLTSRMVWMTLCCTGHPWATSQTMPSKTFKWAFSSWTIQSMVSPGAWCPTLLSRGAKRYLSTTATIRMVPQFQNGTKTYTRKPIQKVKTWTSTNTLGLWICDFLTFFLTSVMWINIVLNELHLECFFKTNFGIVKDIFHASCLKSWAF